ncbi:mechanosensitive ion channel family protein [Chitinophaga barathri]|uniref:Mechanosensitive ion channel family protein n=1 Tax=Chitinophaga barathri TaxID=1647451 RepID=A0A3N4MHU9_9BACT|nr:mechanosensitive ion channel family protein [Chitinophaga barathri]RPD39660.1 mechanosensitive ion channel family protein [Chitinophaga barathri]
MEWTNLIWEKLERWTQAAIRMLPNLALAVIVFTAFFLLARLIRRLVYKLACRISDKQAISNLLATVAHFIVFAVGLFISLEILKLDKAVSSLLAGAGIIGLALGFAFQDLTSNFISGIYITFRKPFDVGHIIETNGFTGSVENIQFRSTTMRTFDGLHLIIPNKDIFQKPIINHSLTTERKIELHVTVPFNKDPAPVLEDIVQTLRNVVKKERQSGVRKAPEVFFENIEGNNLKLLVSLWISNSRESSFNQARHRLITQVLDALRQKQLLP